MSTLLQLRTKARQWVNEPNENGTFSNGLINNLINISNLDIFTEISQQDEAYLAKFLDFPTVAQQELYALPADFMTLISFGVENTTGENGDFDEVSINDRHKWKGNTDLLRNYFDRTVFYFLGAQLGILPIPATVETLRLYYYPTVTDMVLDADVSNLPPTFDTWLTLEVAIKLAAMKKEARPDLQQLMVKERQRSLDFADIRANAPRTVRYTEDER